VIIVRFKAGLGNQMFQYCFYKSLKLEKKFNNIEVKLDTSYYNQYKEQFGYELFHGYELGKVFNIEENLISSEDYYNFLCKNQYIYYPERFFNHDNDIFNFSDNVVFDGYWQTEKYFENILDVIRSDFTFKNELTLNNESTAEKMKNENSISMHVRRGDYVYNPYNAELYGNICTLEYYNKAINILKGKISNPVFYVFSDDINWIKNNLFIENAIYIDWNEGVNSYIDMQLMSCCKHNIIANSTFSWWGAWLNSNEDKIIIAPNKWFQNPNMNTCDLLPKDWIQI
jgi:hypothetical protein